ncbi:MAG: stage II sporulation protein P, partial [Eubacteriales bacterium]
DPAKLASMVPAFTVGTEPLVLIMHTHGSESYAGSADDGETGRSQDISKNVVQVGRVLCETLREAGIPALHDETMYDVPSYTASYNRAFDGITAALEAHPSIRIVIDVHRDAYSYPDGSILATSGEYGGERTARLMFLVGTDAGTLAHPEWRSHLAFAMALQTRLEALAPGIARPVNLRRQRFNEHLTPGSLLLEVGASGDTLEEAERAVRVFGRALAQELGAELS